MITAASSGCGTDAADGVTLKLVAADYGSTEANTSEKYWNDLVRAYEKKTPRVKVEVTVLSWKDVDREVAEMVERDEAPDMAQIGAYADYAKDGKLYPADNLVSIPTQANFLPMLRQAGEVERVQYGLPFGASTRMLFFNRELFEEAGAKPPTDWAELRGAAQKLKAEGVKFPFALPLGSEESQAETMMWLLGGGGGYRDTSGSAYQIDSPANIDTMTWLKEELVGKGLTGPVAPGDLDRQQAFDAFVRGEVGMLNGHPTLMEAAEKAGVKVGKVPLPGVNGKAKATLGVADWMMAFNQNGHRKEIGDFLDFVYEDENVLEFSDRYDLLPVTVTASNTMEEDPRHAALRPFLEALEGSELYPVGDTSWAKVSESVKKNIGRAVRPDGNPRAVLEEIAEAAKAAQAEG
ncbi:extracellular solute-binding protein [Streptomyces somaliensis]|uniref:extracellular solute-binding protein n=1 Tax=Streptomyces somaliensis TaxID=78355 RepID=UPI0020CFB7C9|nr:extracellular solute-binding protein [Streptomyces somaliensis]MCP9944295.1 extracellular solute-binding protein [Streptomyces somaliensis]MCP9962465.1 extracellular solute-binding protein [Streptomyces somaliensis]MCP9975295.1 extracellular solute-binding protein [Streptomyces somaliensis]